MDIEQLFTYSSLRNFSYILQHNKDCYCIDPYDADQILEYLKAEGLNLVAVINTHEHWDHTRGNSQLVSKTGCQVYAHESAKGKIAGVDRFLRKGERLSFEGDEDYLEVLDTPGHTFAHLCLLLVSEERPRAVFTGDTLFNAGVGNCHNGGDPETLYQTISEQFQEMPDDVSVYPGHEYLSNNLAFTLDREPSNSFAQKLLQEHKERPAEKGDNLVTTMGDEKKMNTFLRLDSNEVRDKLQLSEASQKEVFLKLRELRNHW